MIKMVHLKSWRLRAKKGRFIVYRSIFCDVIHAKSAKNQSARISFIRQIRERTDLCKRQTPIYRIYLISLLDPLGKHSGLE